MCPVSRCRTLPCLRSCRSVCRRNWSAAARMSGVRSLAAGGERTIRRRGLQALSTADTDRQPRFASLDNRQSVWHRLPDLEPGRAARATDVHPRLASQCEGGRGGIEAAEANYKQTVLQSLRNVADVLRTVESDAKVQLSLESASASAQESLRLVQQQYALGAASYLQLLGSTASAAGSHQRAGDPSPAPGQHSCLLPGNGWRLGGAVS